MALVFIRVIPEFERSETELRGKNTMQKSSCKRFKGLAVTTADDDREMLVARLRCKQWDCEYCAVKNRQIWRAHIIDRVNAMGGDWLFLTITAHGNAHKAGKTIENLKRAWKKLYDRLRYKFAGQKLEYVWLYEKHSEKDRRGVAKTRYHVHAILRASINGDNVWSETGQYYYHPEMHNWLKDNSASVGAGFMCHACKIQDGNGGLVSAYITKYMTKDAQNLKDFPKGMRRVQTSRGFGSPGKKESEIAWEFRAHLLPGEVLRHPIVTDVSIGQRVTLASFKGQELYPPFEPDDND